MKPIQRDDDVRAVDTFLAEPKTLVGGLPEWLPSERPHELQAIWIVADAVGVERAQLRFRVFRHDRHAPSLSLLFRNRPVWRLDMVPSSECKPNPHWAWRVKAEARVCGPHCHEWPDNRDFLLTGAPVWILPCRRALPPTVRRLPQAMYWLADRLGLRLDGEQRGFDVPPKTDLFGL